MFDRLTKAYIWVMLCMAFSVGTVSVEAHRRDKAIDNAVERALVQGLWSGCSELTNPTRQAIRAIIAQMESHQTLDDPYVPGYGDKYWHDMRKIAEPIDCGSYARIRSSYYQPSK